MRHGTWADLEGAKAARLFLNIGAPKIHAKERLSVGCRGFAAGKLESLIREAK
jgi:hypothetical protein